MYPFLLLFDLCFFQVFQEKKRKKIKFMVRRSSSSPFLYNCVNISN